MSKHDQPNNFNRKSKYGPAYWQERRKISIEKNGSISSKRSYKSKKTVEEKTALALYYQYHIENTPMICENCGTPAPTFSEEAIYSCQAHIVPKEYFLSVAANLDNHMLLPAHHGCGCHNKYDSSWHRASRMPVIELAKQRFLKFKHLIRQEELKYLPEIFSTLL